MNTFFPEEDYKTKVNSSEIGYRKTITNILISSENVCVIMFFLWLINTR